jgi:hypothetical protein
MEEMKAMKKNESDENRKKGVSHETKKALG